MSTLSTGLTDSDGSEILSLNIQAIPVGAILTDGTRFKSNTVTMTVDILPVADTPVITTVAMLPLHSYSENFESYGEINDDTDCGAIAIERIVCQPFNRGL